MVRLRVNGKDFRVSADPEEKLLWVIREKVGFKGTKFGCLKGVCGTCTVLVNGTPIRSCQVSVKDVEDAEITTVEGIPSDHPVKVAWKKVGVPQCGYCQSAQIVTAYALLNKNPKPTHEDIVSAFKGNLCRCGTYPRIVRAVKLASEMIR